MVNKKQITKLPRIQGDERMQSLHGKINLSVKLSCKKKSQTARQVSTSLWGTVSLVG